MKSNLAFGLAVSAGFILASAARADVLPVDPSPAPAVASATAVAAEPKAATEPSVDLKPVASSETKAEASAPSIPPLPARPNATARPREAIAHYHAQQRRDVRRVAMMVGRPRVEDDRMPVRAVPPIFVIGIGY